MVKGYQSERYGGRALVALQAVHRCADMLRDYDVEVYGATECVRSVAAHMAVVAGLRIRAHERLPHARVLDGFGRARVALALGTTDGTPNAMLEAMALGALPIQSDTVSIGEWIEDGRNGLLVPPEDPAAVEAALRRALTDDALVEGAAAINARIVSERAEADTVRDRVLQAYAHAVRCGSEAQRRGSGAAAATS